MAALVGGCAQHYWTPEERKEAIPPPSEPWARGNYLPPDKDWWAAQQPRADLLRQDATAEANALPRDDIDYEKAAAQALARVDDPGAPRPPLPTLTPAPAPAVVVRPWWDELVTRPLDPKAKVVSSDVSALFISAITYSNQIKVFSDVPLIRETGILESTGRFDPQLFLESEIRNVNEPVGSTLKTGGPTRFEESAIGATAGVRQLTSSGARVELAQRFGRLDSNSVYFVPRDQALTRLTLNVVQPLMRGAGFEYNRATTVIAKLDYRAAMDEFQRQVETHLVEVARAYWVLYRKRGELLIKTRLVNETRVLADELGARRGVDANESQLLRARAAVAARQAETVRATVGVRNAEATIVALVNDPNIRVADGVELVPVAPAAIEPRGVAVREAAEHAIQNRPEVRQTAKQMRAAMVRQQISESELLPQLDLVAGVIWNGLEGDYRMREAWANQFQDGRPTLAGGLMLTMPLGNSEAKARFERRRLESRQLASQMRVTLDSVLLEVQVAVREVNAAHREIDARADAARAALADLTSKTERRRLGTDPALMGSLGLDALLDAQLRYALADSEFLDSVVNYNIALVNLDRAMGVLLQTRNIEFEKVENATNLPQLVPRLPGSGAPAPAPAR